MSHKRHPNLVDLVIANYTDEWLWTWYDQHINPLSLASLIEPNSEILIVNNVQISRFWMFHSIFSKCVGPYSVIWCICASPSRSCGLTITLEMHIAHSNDVCASVWVLITSKTRHHRTLSIIENWETFFSIKYQILQTKTYFHKHNVQ